MKKNQNLPAGAWHVPAAILAVLLTAALWAAQLGLVGIQIMTSRGLHERVALNGAQIDAQMTRIAEGLEPIAREYGFSPEPVFAAVSREQVIEMDRQVVEWWTGLLSTGELKEAPVFQADLQNVLEADEGFLSGLNPLAVSSTIESVETRVAGMVRKTGVLFRDKLMSAAFQRAEGMVNLPRILELLKAAPAICGLAALLLAGIIALMMSRKIQTAGQYIGGALSACGLLMLLTLLLIRMLNLREMLSEASQAMLAQYAHLARIITFETAGGAAALMILGGLAMAWSVRARRKAACG